MVARPAPQWFTQANASSRSGPVKGLAQLVREATDGGRALIETLAGIALDDGAAARDRISAAQVLLDRGFGRAVETSLTINADAGSSSALATLSDDALEQLAATLGPTGRTVPLPPATRATALDAIGDAPPEVLECSPLRPAHAPVAPSGSPESVSPPNGADIPAPIGAVPPPAAVRPRRRVVVPSPPTRRAVTSDGGTGTADGAEGPGRKDGGEGGTDPRRPPLAGTGPL